MDGELAGELAEAAGGSIDAGPTARRRRGLRRAPRAVAIGAGAARRDRGGGRLPGGRAARLGRGGGGTAAGPAPSRDRRASAAEAEQRGERAVPRRKEIEDRQHREERRWRTDELRAGFAVLAAAYRDRLVALAAPHPMPPAWSGRTEERVRELSGAIAVVERSCGRARPQPQRVAAPRGDARAPFRRHRHDRSGTHVGRRGPMPVR